MIRNQKILVAVLNWGIGHATRSSPVIASLREKGNRVYIASDGPALEILQNAFPSCQSLTLPGYNVHYPFQNMGLNMVVQLPKILRTISAEKKLVEEYCQVNEIKVIVSDNRYGCYSAFTKNIFMGHQLHLKHSWFEQILNRLHARWINKFDEVWVPDNDETSLSGDLSRSTFLKKNIPIHFIGIQSRLIAVPKEKVYDIAVILSGPEPQRSIFEKKISNQVKSLDIKAILVRGTASSNTLDHGHFNKVIDYANHSTLSNIIAQSSFIICRSGYSTLMDLTKVGGKALLVPTPGQTEQEYLAKRMSKKGIAEYQHQNSLDIASAFKKRQEYSGF